MNATQQRPQSPANAPGIDDQTVSRHFRRAALWTGLFCLAFAMRMIHVNEIRSMPLFDRPISDALVFHQFAQGVAGGDWIGPSDYAHAPTYAYFLGIIYKTVGESPLMVRVIQAIVGAFACLLVGYAGRKFLGANIGLLAAILAACYAPLIYFDAIIQKANLVFFCSASLLAACAWTREKPTALRWFMVGAAYAMLALTRQNALLFAAFLIPWLWLAFRQRSAAKRLAWTILFCTGTIIVFAPWLMRQKKVTGEWILTTPSMGLNLYIGNSPHANGTYLPLVPGRATPLYEQQDSEDIAQQALGRKLTKKEASDFWVDQAMQFIKDKPVSWLRLMARKWILTWHSYEVADAEDFYMYQNWSATTRLLDHLWHFGLLAPLAAAGIVLTWRQRSQLWMLYVWILITAFGVAMFLVFARYRLPLIPVLLLFASAGIIETARAIRLRQGVRLAAAGIVALALALPANASWTFLDQIRREQSGTAYANVGLAYREDGDQQRAVEYLTKALEIDPRNTAAAINLGNALVSLGRLTDAVEVYRKGLAADPDSADLNYNLGYALDRLSQTEEAVAALRRAAKLAPNYLPAQSLLGQILVTERRFDEAVSHYQAALAANPDVAGLHFAASQLYEMGRAHELALGEAIRGIQIDPSNAYEWNRIVTLSIQTGRHAEAVQLARKAARQLPDDLELRNRLAWLLATSPDDASRNGAEALEIAQPVVDATGGKNIHALDSMAAAYAESGRFTEAVQTIDSAIQYADEISNPIAEALRARRQLYETGRAYRYTDGDNP